MSDAMQLARRKVDAIRVLEERLAACGENGWCTISEKAIRQVLDALRVRLPECAEWRHNGSEWKERWICSACGFYQIGERTRFCPGCGAWMGEVEKDAGT